MGEAGVGGMGWGYASAGFAVAVIAAACVYLIPRPVRTPGSARAALALVLVVSAGWILVASLVRGPVGPSMMFVIVVSGVSAGVVAIGAEGGLRAWMLTLAGCLLAIAAGQGVATWIEGPSGGAAVGLAGGLLLWVVPARRSGLGYLVGALWTSWFAAHLASGAVASMMVAAFLAAAAAGAAVGSFRQRSTPAAIAFGVLAEACWLVTVVSSAGWAVAPVAAIGRSSTLEAYSLGSAVIATATIGLLRRSSRVDRQAARLAVSVTLLATGTASALALAWWLVESSAPVQWPVSTAVAVASLAGWLVLPTRPLLLDPVPGYCGDRDQSGSRR